MQLSALHMYRSTIGTFSACNKPNRRGNQHNFPWRGISLHTFFVINWCWREVVPSAASSQLNFIVSKTKSRKFQNPNVSISFLSQRNASPLHVIRISFLFQNINKSEIHKSLSRLSILRFCCNLRPKQINTQKLSVHSLVISNECSTVHAVSELLLIWLPFIVLCWLWRRVRRAPTTKRRN